MGNPEKNQPNPQGGSANPPERLRLSVWVPLTDVMKRGGSTLESGYASVFGQIDDLSLQATFCNDKSMADPIRWDPLFFPGAKDAERDAWLAQVVKLHPVRVSLEVGSAPLLASR